MLREIIDPRGGARTDNFGELLVNGLPVEVGLLQEGDGSCSFGSSDAMATVVPGTCPRAITMAALHSVDELSNQNTESRK